MLRLKTAIVLLTCVLGASAPFSTAGAQETRVEPALSAYAHPARLVDLPGGRKLNLDCRGTGAPTVLLLPGRTGWSSVWWKVHDKLAAQTRTCAFDPAGFGFSSASALPQTASHIVDDLKQALKSAGIAGPYLLVGHSAGGYQALSFADRWRKDLAGMVLVDPSFPGQTAEFNAIAPKMSAQSDDGDTKTIATLRACAAAMKTGAVAWNAPTAGACFNYKPEYPDDLRIALAAAANTPEIIRTKESHLLSFAVSSREAVKPARSYGDLRLIVLTRGDPMLPPGPPPPGYPPEAASESLAADALWVRAHESLAARSTCGEHRIVPHTGHMIELEQPDAVVAAVRDVLARSRGGAK